MQNEKNGMSKGLLIGMLTGAAVGSVIALLYAPKPGKELREDIKTKSQDFIEDADQYRVEIKDKVSQLINKSKKKSGKLVAEVKEKVDILLWEAERLLTESKDKDGNMAYQSKE